MPDSDIFSFQSFVERFSVENLRFSSMDDAVGNTVSIEHLLTILKTHRPTQKTSREEIVGTYVYYTGLWEKNLTTNNLNTQIQKIVDRGGKFERQSALMLAIEQRDEFKKDLKV
ncbi:MAG: hypothetical protein COB41_05635 [Proteobacteria bacterium]|nr:MAG: hypothetical protein COB41_05535 [Pseudomonadota bacterium]PCI44018.1 MAG: hypothetical protein COB41_05635 [Pseudomonadota bacterium]